MTPRARTANANQGISLSVRITISQVGNLLAPVVRGVLIDRVSWMSGFGFAAALAFLGLVTILVAPPTL